MLQCGAPATKGTNHTSKRDSQQLPTALKGSRRRHVHQNPFARKICTTEPAIEAAVPRRTWHDSASQHCDQTDNIGLKAPGA